MRILHVLDHSLPLHSGYAFRTIEILKGQRALGWETYHLTSPKQGGSSLEEETDDGWHFYRTPAVSGLVTGLPGLGEIEMMGELAQRIEDVVRRVKPHVLHAHSPVLNAIPAIRVGRRLGIPVVYEVRAFWEDAAVDHGTTRENSLRYRITRALETFALKRVDAITTICEGLRKDIHARGIPASKITVIPNAVDIGSFSVSDNPDTSVRNRHGLADAVVLGFIGSFYAYEGLALLLRGLPDLVRRIPQARILLVGGGPQEQELRTIAHETGLDDWVTFTGRVPHAEVQRYYDAIDILVYPRLSMRLTDLVTPLKPLEAMAQGRLVLASDVGWHLELMQNGKNAIIFRAGDVANLVDQAVFLINARDRWDSLRKSARTFVERERNWTSSVAGYRDVYENLVRRMAA